MEVAGVIGKNVWEYRWLAQIVHASAGEFVYQHKELLVALKAELFPLFGVAAFFEGLNWVLNDFEIILLAPVAFDSFNLFKG